MPATDGGGHPSSGSRLPLGPTWLQDEAAQIRQVLEQTQGNVVQAARRLGLKRSTLRYRMVRAGLGAPRGGAAPALRTARRGATLPPAGEQPRQRPRGRGSRAIPRLGTEAGGGAGDRPELPDGHGGRGPAL